MNISRAQPFAELFAPPPDYTMEDLAAPAYPIGKDVSAPHLVSKVEPAYTEEARKSKLSGTVLLSLIVDTDGVPQNIKVVRPLRYGLG